jgi:predicted MPP superfamily phosphohydrolase
MMILILALVFGLHAYLPWRLGYFFGLKNKKWLYAIFAAGLVSGPAAMSLITKSDHFLISVYYNATWTWLGSLLFLTLSLAVFEIVNLFYKLPPKKSGIILIALSVAMTIYSLINAISFKVSNIAIPIKGLKSNVRIVQISDAHIGAARGESYLAKIVNKTNELKPDFVVITGDIVDGKSIIKHNMLAPLKDLHSPAYFVFGNHDAYIGFENIIKIMKENNVTVLQNEALETNGIKLIGLSYMKADDTVYDPHQISNETIKDVLPTLDLGGDHPLVVLHHGPWGIEYLNDHGIDLVLAGHTHAGQMFPFSILTSIFYPFNKGLVDYRGTYIYISQGAGTFVSRMRFGTKNEINFIALEPHGGQ